jgi:FMN phosphatase YigB (HAD superfamily)
MLRSVIPMQEIRYVLLDMDGTLLDKYFDDYFWEHLLPEKFAEKKNISFGRAKEELLEKYRAHEGTLNWTDIDFWSREVQIDIPALKEQIKHLIEVHPHVEDFLKMLKRRRKKVFLVTNAHYKVLDIKLKKTEIGIRKGEEPLHR